MEHLSVSLESCFFPSFDTTYLTDLKQQLDEYGFDRVYAWGHPDGLEAGTSEKAKREMIEHIEYAKLIGAQVMRVVGSSFSFLHEPHAPQLKILTRWFKEAVAVAESVDIKLAIENHIDYTADEILALVEAVGSNHFGVNLDTANFLRLLDDPVEASRKLAPYTFATHIKDVQPVKGRHAKAWNYFASVPAGEGLIDIKSIARILHESRYQGFLAFETDMPHDDWCNREEEMIEQSIETLKDIVATLEPANV